MFYANCHLMCPLILENAKAVQKQLPAPQRDRLGVAMITLDPARDTPAALAEGRSPAAGRETLTADQRHDEDVLLGVRLRDGLPVVALDDDGRAAVAGLVADGLVDGHAAVRDRRVVLTRRGRLLADAVVRRLLGV